MNISILISSIDWLCFHGAESAMCKFTWIQGLKVTSFFSWLISNFVTAADTGALQATLGLEQNFASPDYH